jgi:hypothetical protein
VYTWPMRLTSYELEGLSHKLLLISCLESTAKMASSADTYLLPATIIRGLSRETQDGTFHECNEIEHSGGHGYIEAETEIVKHDIALTEVHITSDLRRI